ncbi:MAG: hypothetical protein QM778_18680 [Myxococcales bacterium]
MDLSDPAPTQPDLNGLVPIAGLRLAADVVDADTGAKQLSVIDFTTGMVHAAAKANRDKVALAPGAAGYLYADVQGEVTNNLLFTRLVPGGFIPEKTISGYADKPGIFSFLASSGDSRFNVYAFGGSNRHDLDSQEIIDLATGSRFGSLPVNEDGSTFSSFAPQGHYFRTNFGHSSSGSATNDIRWGKLTKDGTSPLVALGQDASFAQFSDDGTHLYYAKPGTAGQGLVLYVAQLPYVGTPLQLDRPLATFAWMVRAGAGGSNLFAQLTVAEKPGWYRITPEGKTEHLLDVNYDSEDFAENDSLRAISSNAGAAVRIEIQDLKTMSRQTLTTRAKTNATVTDHHAYYYEGTDLHVVGLDATGVQNVVVNEAGETVDCPVFLRNSLVYRVKETQALVFISLEGPTATRIGTLPLPLEIMDRSCLRPHVSKDKYFFSEYSSYTHVRKFWVIDFDGKTLGTASATAYGTAPGTNLVFSSMIFDG